MLSKKLTFSLTNVLVLLAFGFAFAVPSAIGAEWWQYRPEASLSVNDVSSAPGNQVEAYKAGSVENNVFSVGDPKNFEFYIKVTKGEAIVDTAAANGNLADVTADDDELYIGDLRFILLDKDGIVISKPDSDAATVHGSIGLLGASSDTKIEAITAGDRKNFKVTIASGSFSVGEVDAAAILVHLAENTFRNVEPTAVAASLVDAKARQTGLNKKSPDDNLPIMLVAAESNDSTTDTIGVPLDPKVVSIVRIVPTASIARSRFQEAQVSGPFQVRITLTEEGKDFAKDGKSDYIDVKNGTLTSIVPGVPFAAPPPDRNEGGYTESGDGAVPSVSGRDKMYHPYLVTIEPNLVASTTAHENQARSVEIRVKAFDDLYIPANGWVPPTNYALAVNRSLLSVPINPAAIQTSIFKPADDAKTGNEVFLPGAMIVEPGEYLVVARGADAGESGVVASPAKDDDKKTAAQKLYTTAYGVDFPYPGDNLEIFFRNGGQIALLHEDNPGNNATNADNKYAAASASFTAGDLVISEIMWGTDQHLASKDDRPQDSQWIELLNTTDATIHIDEKEWKLAFYSSAGSAPSDAIDVVGNATPYWQVKGSSGATQGSRVVYITDKGNVIPGGAAVPSGEKVVSTTTETYPGGSLASMYRAIPADKKSALDGTLESSWTASPPQGTVNLSGLRYGTPGGDNPAYVAPVAPPPPVVAPPPKAPVATAADLRISEIMVASNNGKLPQWIEIANIGVAAVSLTGWSISIDNDPTDAAVVAPSVNLKLGDVVIGADQVALVVSKAGRNSGVDTAGAARTKGDANAGDLDADRIIDVQKDVSTKAQYSLISETAFRISLIPPLPSGVVDRGDVVGNLGMGWDLPMFEGDRSSLVRLLPNDTKRWKAEVMGTDAAAWTLASESSLVGAYVSTFYGDADDMGTPGYDAGGALPVELSKFNAKRDPLTGQVMITWETQSELNNAGFFIKRSQQKNGQFVAVNPTMIPGAGTISEKQSYTYTDTTAQPNIVYYYQIEDVSLDGNRQTLTRAHRLKGHIGAAGKATTTWGDLKTSLEQ